MERMTPNDQIACPECGYGWNEFTHGFHYTHCSKVAHLNRERVQPAQASECAYEHPWKDCPKCGVGICQDHMVAFLNHPPHHNTPTAPERVTQHYKACEVAKEIGHSPLPWRVVDFGDKSGSETSVIHIDCHVPRRGGQGMTVAELFYYDSWQNSEVSRSVVEANAKLIVEAVNQHSTLIAQRDRLLEAARFALSTPGFIRGRDSLQRIVDEVLTTSEQERRDLERSR